MKMADVCGFFVVFKFLGWFWFGFGLVSVLFCFHFDQCLFAFDRGQGSWSGFLTARHIMYLNLLCYLFCVAPVSASSWASHMQIQPMTRVILSWFNLDKHNFKLMGKHLFPAWICVRKQRLRNSLVKKFFEDLHYSIILLNESLDPVKYMSTLLLISVSSKLLPVSPIEQRI